MFARVRKETLPPKPCTNISKIDQTFVPPPPSPSLLFVDVINK